MNILLTLLSGISWMIVYEQCIRLGFKQKTYAMPLLALGLNLAWENIHSIYGFACGDFSMQTIVNTFWCFLDVLILVTWLRYGYKEFGNHTKKTFYSWTILALVMSYFVQWGFVLEFDRILGMQYSAYIQNLIMSVMFIALLEKRQSAKGQSMTLATAKWIGTLAPLGIVGMNFGTDTFQPLIIILGIFCSVFDLLYIYLLSRKIKGTDIGQV